MIGPGIFVTVPGGLLAAPVLPLGFRGQEGSSYPCPDLPYSLVQLCGGNKEGLTNPKVRLWPNVGCEKFILHPPKEE